MAMEKTNERAYTVSGEISSIEISRGKTLWVALVLKESPVWKIIVRDSEAEAAVEVFKVGDNIMAAGRTIKPDENVIKFFADALCRISSV